MGGLYLFGTHHFDPDGPQRIWNVLNKLRPDNVAVESDEKYASYVMNKNIEQGVINNLLRHPDANYDVVRNFEHLHGYEAYNAQLYCRIYGTPIHFVDVLYDKGKNGDKHWKAQVKMTMDMTLDEFLAEKPYVEDSQLTDEDIDELLLRDAMMEAHIRMLEGVTVLFVGFTHLFGNYHNLYERLIDKNPQRYMLNYADQL